MSYKILPVQEFITAAEPHPTVQRGIIPKQVQTIAESFVNALSEDSLLRLPCFFAVAADSDETNYLVYDGQHRLAALNLLFSESWQNLGSIAEMRDKGLLNFDVCVSVLPFDTDGQTLRNHFRYVNCGKSVTKNLAAAFSSDWAKITSQLSERVLFQTEVAKGNTGISKLFAVANIESSWLFLEDTASDRPLTPLFAQLLDSLVGKLPEAMQKSHNRYLALQHPIYSASFLKALCEATKYIIEDYRAAFIETIEDYIINAEMPQFTIGSCEVAGVYVETPTGTKYANSTQQRTSWVFWMLSLMAKHNPTAIFIPFKKSAIAYAGQPFGLPDLDAFVESTPSSGKTRAKADTEPTVSEPIIDEPPVDNGKGKGKGKGRGKSANVPDSPIVVPADTEEINLEAPTQLVIDTVPVVGI